MASAFRFSTEADQVVSVYSEHVKGRVFLVTGPTPNGIGDETVRALAKAHPAAILLVGRSPAKYTPVVDAIHSIDPNIVVRVYDIDLGSINSVRSGVLKIVQETEHIDVLINNAGVMGVPLRKSVNGIEEHFATNHIGHFLLTNMLMKLLLKSSEPRIVNLTSAGHRTGTGDYSDYNFEKTEYAWAAWLNGYGQSKLANIHFTYYLAKVLGPRGVTAFSVHPGTIWTTNLTTPLGDEGRESLHKWIDSIGVKEKTGSQGASTTLYAALDPDLGKEHNGAYLEDCHVAETLCDGAKIPDAPEKLWKLSETLVNETFAY